LAVQNKDKCSSHFRNIKKRIVVFFYQRMTKKRQGWPNEKKKIIILNFELSKKG
jgi:hypothetical protein